MQTDKLSKYNVFAIEDAACTEKEKKQKKTAQSNNNETTFCLESTSTNERSLQCTFSFES